MQDSINGYLLIFEMKIGLAQKWPNPTANDSVFCTDALNGNPKLGRTDFGMSTDDVYVLHEHSERQSYTFDKAYPFASV